MLIVASRSMNITIFHTASIVKLYHQFLNFHILYTVWKKFPYNSVMPQLESFSKMTTLRHV